MAAKLELLVPVELLPAEGEDVPEFKSRNGSTTSADLLKYFLELTGGAHLGFRVGEAGIEALNGAGEGVLLQHSRFVLDETGENEGQPYFDFSDKSATLDVNPILTSEESGSLAVEENAGPEEYVRAFLEQFTCRVEAAAGEFEGTPIPLLRWAKSDGGDVEVGFCGVVLADDEALENLRDGGAEGIAIDPSMGIVLEESEIEGRGLREVAISVAILGITLAATPNAEAGPRKFGAGPAHSQSSLMEALSGIKLFDYNKHGEKIQTIKANDKQAPARINKTLLEEAETDGGSRQVVVDVDKQRAYVIIDGEIAIDTPVSTARTGKHTPRGEFKITQRVRSGKTSTIYGCDLPYWQRLDESAVGMHVGPLPGYPASAGCIRLPEEVAPIIFDATSRGVTVRVVDSWQQDTMVAGL